MPGKSWRTQKLGLADRSLAYLLFGRPHARNRYGAATLFRYRLSRPRQPHEALAPSSTLTEGESYLWESIAAMP